MRSDIVYIRNVNWIDGILLILLLWYTYRGFKKGLIISVVSLIALVLAIFVGLRLWEVAADFLTDRFALSSSLVPILGFGLVFILVLLVVRLIGVLMEKLIDLAGLKLINKLLGSLFGLLKGALILGFVLVLLQAIDRKIPFLPDEKMQNSPTSGMLSSIPSLVVPVLAETDWYKEVSESWVNESSP